MRDIYQEVYRPMGYQDHCFVHVRTDPGSTVFVGFFRDDGFFSEEDKLLLELLQPHPSNARQPPMAAASAAMGGAVHLGVPTLKELAA